jgi:glycosyltransferase involved in cell wall biosynthesis
MTRLCFVNPHVTQRTVVYELAKHLAKNGDYEITIIQPARGGKLGDNFCSQWIDGLEVMFFPAFFLPKISYNIPFLHKEIDVLVKLFHDKKCDIIQAVDYDYLTSIAPIIVKKRCKIPIILTSDALPGYSWFYGDRFVDAIAKMYTFSIGKKILNSYDRVVFLYRRALEEVEKFSVSRERAYVIPNGVDVDKYSQSSDLDQLRAKLSLNNDEKVLLFVGRLAKVKRVEILIALTKSLVNDGFKIKTVIVGDGPSRGYYEELAKSLTRNVTFVGQVPHKEVSKYYNIADVFVLPSLSEGLPTVCLEASAAGKPCVATYVNGVPDIVIHGHTGYLVEKSDLPSYERYVRLLLEDEDLCGFMGRNAAKFVKENFSWDVVTKKYEEIFRDLKEMQA